MTAMVVTITLAFLIRSSSIVGFIPLALQAIFAGSFPGANLWVIILAGLSVAVPLCLMSATIDSAYYGRPTLT